MLVINQRPFAKMADGRESQLFSSKSLYELCVSAVADRFRSYKPHLADLPKNVRFDLYYQVNVKLSARQRQHRPTVRPVCIYNIVIARAMRFVFARSSPSSRKRRLLASEKSASRVFVCAGGRRAIAWRSRDESTSSSQLLSSI